MKRLAFLAIAILTATLASAEPRWQPVGPQAGPPHAHLFFGPGGGAYALTPAGLWRARPGGAWSSVQVEGLGSPFLAFATAPSTPGRAYGSVLRPDGFSVIVRTDDGGNSWQTVSPIQISTRIYPEVLRVDPFKPGTLYRADSFLTRSQDGGRTWDCVPFGGYCAGSVDDFALAPDRPGTMYVSAGLDFYRTADGGRTWAHSVLETPMDFLVATRAPRMLYGWLGEPFRGDSWPCLMRSDDEGMTWKSLLQAPRECGAPGIDPSDPRTVRIALLADGEPRLWVSRDGGDHWSEKGVLPGVGDLFVTPSRELILSTPDGLYRAPGENGPWRAANRGFTVIEVQDFIAVEETFLASPRAWVSGPAPPAVAALRTENGGRTWSPAPLRNVFAFAADPSDPLHLIAAAQRYESPSVAHSRVLESRDGGRSWSGVVDPAIDPPGFSRLAIDPEDSRIFYGGNYLKGFYRSQDGGRTWAAANSGLPYEEHCTPYYCDSNWVSAILPRKETGTVAIVFENQVFVSRDRGSSWRQASPYITPLGNVQVLARDPEGNLVAVAGGKNPGDADSFGVVYRSRDEGVTWRRLGRLPPKVGNHQTSFVSSIAATREGIFVSTNLLGVLFSANGAAWRPLNAGLPGLHVTSLVTDPSDPASVYATVYQSGVYVLRGR